MKENILLGRGDGRDEEIVEGGKMGKGDEFIMNLGEGYESEVGEGGVKVCGGEKEGV
ncbi:hypothetical protein [Staphylococcus capitis]|uniref:hypothetical protein n=1 Tax=Staphylococcus capitis TaxID=29388 RepID=UPI001642B989|nr:hypothetical protein [Staphylococcus capitis]